MIFPLNGHPASIYNAAVLTENRKTNQLGKNQPSDILLTVTKLVTKTHQFMGKRA